MRKGSTIKASINMTRLNHLESSPELIRNPTRLTTKNAIDRMLPTNRNILDRSKMWTEFFMSEKFKIKLDNN